MSSKNISCDVLVRGSELPQEVSGWLLDRAGSDARYVVTPPLPGQVPDLIKRHGYKMAVTIARITDDPKLLARLARNSSVQVRRAVADNRHTDQPTLDYLWRWAVKRRDSEVLAAVVPALSFDALLSSADPLPANSSFRHDPSADVAVELLTGSVSMLANRVTASPPHAAAMDRLRDATHSDCTVENFRAAVTHRCPLLALQATLLCVSDQVDGLPFAEALSLFAASHHSLGADPASTVERRLAAACVGHALRSDGVAVDAALAELAVQYRDLIVPAHQPAPDHQDWEVTHFTPPVFDSRASAEAVDVFLDSGVPEYCAAAVLSADKAQLRRLMASTVLPLPVLYWPARANPRLLPSDLLVETLSVYWQRALQSGEPVEVYSELVAAADGVPQDLLRWLLRQLSRYDVAAFVCGRFATKPSPEFLAGFIADALDDPPRLWTWPNVEDMVVYRADEWGDQPWADVLLGLFSVQQLSNARSTGVVADRLITELGKFPQLWSAALNLLDNEFPGTLPELVDMVWALTGDGLTRPAA